MPSESDLDETDIKLCQLLLANSRLSYDELANKLGLSINAVHKRVKTLVDLKIIRSFTARLSLTAVSAINIWVYGRSLSKHLQEAHLRLQKNDSTYWVAYSGGEFLYVGGYLRDISELDSYSIFVKNEGQIDDPTVALFPTMPRKLPINELHPLDYQIIAPLRRDSRKPLADVASELDVTTKTIRNRLEKMIDNQLVDLTIEWYPDASNDIFAIYHLTLANNFDRMSVASSLTERFFPNLLFSSPFGNLPNQLGGFAWTNTMKQLEEIRAQISKTKGIESIMLNVLQIGYIFDTWRDKLVLERANQA